MSGQSSVGTSGVYEAGDQRNLSKEEKESNKAERYEEGKQNSHLPNDSSTYPPLPTLSCSLASLKVLPVVQLRRAGKMCFEGSRGTALTD